MQKLASRKLANSANESPSPPSARPVSYTTRQQYSKVISKDPHPGIPPKFASNKFPPIAIRCLRFRAEIEHQDKNVCDRYSHRLKQKISKILNFEAKTVSNLKSFLASAIQKKKTSDLKPEARNGFRKSASGGQNRTSSDFCWPSATSLTNNIIPDQIPAGQWCFSSSEVPPIILHFSIISLHSNKWPAT